MGMNDSVQVPCDMLQKYYSLSFSKRTKHIYFFFFFFKYYSRIGYPGIHTYFSITASPQNYAKSSYLLLKVFPDSSTITVDVHA